VVIVPFAPFAPFTPVTSVVAPTAPVVNVPFAPITAVLEPFSPIVAQIISPFAPIPAVTPILQTGIQAVAPVAAHSRFVAHRAHVATRTPVVSQPAAPAPVPVPPAPPTSAGGAAAGAGSSGTFFASAVLLAMLMVALPRLFGRLRLFAELGRPAPFVLLLAEPG
jgi:hypothetical protein